MSYNTKLEEKIDAAATSLTRSLSQKRGEGLVDKDISIRWLNVEKKKMFTLHSREHSLYSRCALIITGRRLVNAGCRRRAFAGCSGATCASESGSFLIVRMDKEQGEHSLKDKNVQPFDITGKPMAGWVMVKEGGWKSAAGLAKWVGIGKEFALSLPEKKSKGRARKTKTLREYKA